MKNRIFRIMLIIACFTMTAMSFHLLRGKPRVVAGAPVAPDARANRFSVPSSVMETSEEARQAKASDDKTLSEAAVADKKRLYDGLDCSTIDLNKSTLSEIESINGIGLKKV